MYLLWKSILFDLAPSDVTPDTLSTIYLRAPAFSRSDERLPDAALKGVQQLVGNPGQYQVFPRVSKGQRGALLARLRSCTRILSFHSFFEDTIYLEIPHHSMRCLLPNRQVYCESCESAFSDLYLGPEETFWHSYIQLWLYVMRHFPDLSDLAASRPRKDRGQPKPLSSGPRQKQRRAFTQLAWQLGSSVEQGR